MEPRERAKVTIELLPDDVTAGPLILSLHDGFREHCKDIECAVVRKAHFLETKTLEQSIAYTIANARAAVPATQCINTPWSVYLSPRKMHLMRDGSYLPASYSTLMMAVSVKQETIAIFLYTIASKKLPTNLAYTLDTKLAEARDEFIARNVTEEEEAAVRGFIEAIGFAYQKAYPGNVMN